MGEFPLGWRLVEVLTIVAVCTFMVWGIAYLLLAIGFTFAAMLEAWRAWRKGG